MYSDLILALYNNPPHFGPLREKTATHTMNNPSCGDVLTVDMNIDAEQGIVVDMTFYGESCAITRAAAVLADHIIGKRRQIAQMNVETMYELIGNKIHPGRVKCLLLPLENVNILFKTPESKDQAHPSGPALVGTYGSR
jgi:nitrogen fixation NifU-like protein